MKANIPKLYISHFLTGLVFWFGIEKLFMQSIGIDATQIGLIIAAFLLFNALFDLPSGILADRWSRKGTLLIAVASMAICSLILGWSQGFWLYFVGYVLFRGLNVIGTSGTYQAIMYDTLLEEKREAQYSKYMGRSYAWFMTGIALSNVLSGILSDVFDFRFTFFITLVPCLVNFFIVWSIREPKTHHSQQTERPLKQLGMSLKMIGRASILRSLIIIFSLISVTEVFKNDFGQLYLARYVSSVEFIGILWALAALSWALGNLIAHRLHARVSWLITAAVIPLMCMSLIDNAFSIVLFMLQHVAMAALFNQVEARVQEATPSSVRSSMISVLSSMGRVVSIPGSIIIGIIISYYDVVWGLRFATFIAVIALVFWFIVSRNDSVAPKAHEDS